MAYRRRQGIARVSTFKEENRYPTDDTSFSSTISDSPPSSLAAQAIRASAVHRQSSSLSSAYADSAFSSAQRDPDPQSYKLPTTYEYTSLNSSIDSKNGLWSMLAKKAKSILEDDEQFELTKRTNPVIHNTSPNGLFNQPYQAPESFRKRDNPKLRKGLDAITSSLNQIGGTLGNAFEEGRTMVESKTADIIEETKKLQIRRKGNNLETQKQAPLQQASQQTNPETQLKASRDVAMATAAKAKLLVRELKTVKADLAFAKERCTQLEEEIKMLRASAHKGAHPADDELIRLQLETLLAEKARLAHENSVHARENRFLREIVEYHQLKMQDVVYVNNEGGIEEVSSPSHLIVSQSPTNNDSMSEPQNPTTPD